MSFKFSLSFIDKASTSDLCHCSLVSRLRLSVILPRQTVLFSATVRAVDGILTAEAFSGSWLSASSKGLLLHIEHNMLNDKTKKTRLYMIPYPPFPLNPCDRSSWPTQSSNW